MDQIKRFSASLFLCLSMLFVLPCAAALAKEKKLCLTMIVKNKSKTIEQCLESVKEIVDCVCVCDVGSTDNTPSIVSEFLATHEIPGHVYHHDWVDFGHNRTLSAVAAKNMVQSLGFSLNDTYLLLLDADMVVNISPEFNKSQLSSDSYMVEQSVLSTNFYNIRLINASQPWTCIGPAREYWSCQSAKTNDTLNTLSITCCLDNRGNDHDYDQEIRLLAEALNKEPNNPRILFYLAQANYDIGQYDEAIKWYQARIEQKGWIEEVWYSMYKIGTAYDSLGKQDLALNAYKKAFCFLPTRAEPLEKLALHYCLEKQYEQAYALAACGTQIPYPKNHLLFVAADVYDYRFDELLSIAAYYTPHKSEGLAALKRLLDKPTVPLQVKSQAQDNLHFYKSSNE